MKKALKVLMVEDDPNICELVQLYVEKEGYQFITRYQGEKGMEAYYEEDPDFVILDIMLPEVSGWEICKEIRRDNPLVPIIMLTGKGESYDKIRGLELGADDYVVKPFDPNELIARMKAVMRRANLLDATKEKIELNSLTIDMKQYKVYLDGRKS